MQYCRLAYFISSEQAWNFEHSGYFPQNTRILLRMVAGVRVEYPDYCSTLLALNKYEGK
jgi:hypothetical protein